MSEIPPPRRDSSAKQREFNPHAETISPRDWGLIAYLAGLVILPLIAAVVLCGALFLYFPEFDNFPKGPAPLGPLPETAENHKSES